MSCSLAAQLLRLLGRLNSIAHTADESGMFPTAERGHCASALDLRVRRYAGALRITPELGAITPAALGRQSGVPATETWPVADAQYEQALLH